MKVEKKIQKGYEKYEFPLNEAEIESILEKLPSEDLEGLESVVITNPIKNEDFKRYGRYDEELKTIYLFAHLKNENEKIVIDCGFREKLGKNLIIKLTLDEFRDLSFHTLFHEVGHHIGIRDFKDRLEEFANNYAYGKLTEFYSSSE